jgi:hypothetical protein
VCTINQHQGKPTRTWLAYPLGLDDYTVKSGSDGSITAADSKASDDPETKNRIK